MNKIKEKIRPSSGFYPYLWWWGSPALCPPTRQNRPTRPGNAHQSLRASQPLLPTPRALAAPSWRRSWSGRGPRPRCSPPGRGGSRGWTLCQRGRSPVPPPPPPPGCPGEHVSSPAAAFACTNKLQTPVLRIRIRIPIRRIRMFSDLLDPDPDPSIKQK